jgi:hypothetical protein
MRLITANSHPRSKNLKQSVEALGGNSSKPYMFSWTSDFDNYPGCVDDMKKAVVAVSGEDESAIEFIEVQPKTLKKMGWDIVGIKWQDSAVFVFVTA